MRTMRNKLAIVVTMLSVLGLFAYPTSVHAADVTVKAVCNVNVTFKATVPDSVRQGDSFTVSNIAISPSNSYGFTVSSSIYDFSATNTSSTTYHQNYISTSPSPTTGHNTYWAYYPNWVINANGPVGSSVVVTIKKSVTVVQGYGTVNCNFNKQFFAVPITSPASSPSPSPSASPSPSPTNSSKPSPSPSASSKPRPSSTPQQTAAPSTTATPSPDPSDGPEPSFPESPTVVPLIIKVRNDSGKIVQGAEVTLNGSTKAKTDKDGVVKFENILTGSHSLVVTFASKKITHSIHVDDQDVGTAIVVSLPEDPLIMNPFVIGGITVGIVALGTPLAIFALRRYRSRPELTIPAGAIPLQGIVSGSATPTPAETKLSHIPAIPMFEAQAAPTTIAPWETVPLVQSMQPSEPAQMSAPAVISIPVVAPTEPAMPTTQAPVAPQPEPAPAESIEAAISAQLAAPIPQNQQPAPAQPTIPSTSPAPTGPTQFLGQ